MAEAVMNSRIPENWRSPIRIILYVFAAFFVALLLATLLRRYIVELVPEGWFFNSARNFDALLISLWGAIITLLLGGLSVILSLRRPEDEMVDSRVNFLFSSTKLSDGVRAYNREKIKKLSAYCSSVDAQIYIDEIDRDAKAFKVEIEIQQVLQNCLHNFPCVDEKSDFRVSADEVSGKKILGEVRCIELTSAQSVLPDWKLERRVKLVKDQPSYNQPIRLAVEANESARLIHQHWIWCSLKQGYSYDTMRYSENVTIRLTNRTDELLRICCVYCSGEQRTESVVNLKPDKCELLANGVTIKPGRQWAIFPQ